jgi:predicted dehydrogenase/nucleoside-diphosphate-sugar epimerase
VKVMAKSLGVGLIGFGKMGINHVKAINSSMLGEVVAVADPVVEPSRVEDILGKTVPVFRDARDLLREVKTDIVHVVTPPNTHYGLAKGALEKGSHIYVEKPFVTNITEALDLFEVAAQKNLQICAGHQLLAHPVTRKAEIYALRIGRIVHVESYFSFRMVRKNISTVEQLIDILPHPVYTLLHFLHDRLNGDMQSNLLLKDFVAEPSGEVRALIQRNGVSGMLVVSLGGRPVDSYLKIVGTHGSIYIDYVRGVVINLPGRSADAIGAIMIPYRQGLQGITKTTASLASLFLKKNKSYGGLSDLISSFYSSILHHHQGLFSQQETLDTVQMCSEVANRLNELQDQVEARAKFHHETEQRPKSGKTDELVLITGGSGFLGSSVVQYLKEKDRRVRVVSRRLVPFSSRIPGVEYISADLSRVELKDALRGVSAVIHCAAETAGGKEDHIKNSIEATKRIFEASREAAVSKFVHISSLGVLKPGRFMGKPLDEASPVESDNLGRGPYVWGKAEAEKWLIKISNKSSLKPKIIRPGPLVDFNNFETPGRLGREMGPIYLVMGSKRSSISICDVWTVAKTLNYYLDNYESAPPLLNLVEPQSTTRENLVKKILEARNDIKPIYVPTIVVKVASMFAKFMQKIIFPSRKPIDIAAAFASERYNTSQAKEIINRASSEQKNL